MDGDSEDIQVKNEGAYVKDGKLMFSTGGSNDSKFTVKLNPSKHMKIIVDGCEFEKACEVTSKNDVKVEMVSSKPERRLDINISSDKLKVYACVEYIYQQQYKLKDLPISRRLDFVEEFDKEIQPPLYTIDEVKEILKSKNVVYGLNLENIKSLCEDKSGTEYMVAEGKEIIETVQDTVKLEFEKEKIHKVVDDAVNIDFREVKDIAMVKPGEKIGEIILGKQGEDGVSVNNKPIKCAKYIAGAFNIGEGAARKDNLVISTIEGMPEFKNNTFCVKRLYQVDSNVDLSTGNVNFIGSVLVKGNVSEGMTVVAGSDVNIAGNVELAKILAKGDLHISGNVIGSTVVIGGEDVDKKQELNTLINLKEELSKLQQTVYSIKEKNVAVNRYDDGELIKVLVESKFKSIITDCMSIIRFNLKEKGKFDDLVMLAREKLIGLAPVKIKHINELDCICTLTDEYIKEISTGIKIHSKAIFSYIQGTNVSCSGDIYIDGRGAYTSNIIANNSIYFTRKDSVLRGGRLQAEKEIRCGVIGSDGHVTTVVEIVGKGEIWAEVAYANTIFKIKGKTLTLQDDSKNIHVYLDEMNMIDMDKLSL